MDKALTERGYRVDLAETGESALARLKQEPYDLILLDELLPGASGLDVLQSVRELPDPPEVVLLTAHGSVRSAVEAIKLGAFDYIQKPYDIEQLDALLRRAIEMRRLSREVSMLRGALSPRSIPPLTVHSPQMQEVLRIIKKCAPTDSTVLIQGETGTGKELVANEIYQRSRRKDKPFIPVNCGALQEQLLESELFGHEKGSFTGAVAARHGLFDVTDGGTIFLDEIGEMHPNTQVKLLRVLQSGEVRRVGGNRVAHVDVRVIASTNKDLAKETQRGAFREDLFYRLSVLTIRVPPLRERKEEIPGLVACFLAQACARLRIEPAKQLPEETLAVLLRHDWPGNVRELENIIELAVVLSDGPVIRPSDLPPHLLAPIPAAISGSPDASSLSLEQVEMQHVLHVLQTNAGNKRKTARDLGIDTKTLYNKLRKLNIAGI